MRQFYLENRWMLRWRLDYADGSHRAGIWSSAVNAPNNRASLQPRKGLVAATVEGKNILDRNIQNFVSCTGNEFKEFKWIALSSLSRGMLPLHGLTLVTKDKQTSIYIDGSKEVKTKE